MTRDDLTCSRSAVWTIGRRRWKFQDGQISDVLCSTGSAIHPLSNCVIHLSEILWTSLWQYAHSADALRATSELDGVQWPAETGLVLTANSHDSDPAGDGCQAHPRAKPRARSPSPRPDLAPAVDALNVSQEEAVKTLEELFRKTKVYPSLAPSPLLPTDRRFRLSRPTHLCIGCLSRRMKLSQESEGGRKTGSLPCTTLTCITL